MDIKQLVESGQLSVLSAEVSPADARYLLSLNTNNRNLSKTTVRRYARTMREGRWVPNVAIVSVDVNGEISNGQHTLSAIVESGRTVSVTLQVGMPAVSRDVFDTGNRRSIGDVLSMAGIENANRIGAAVNLARQWEDLFANERHPVLRNLSTRRTVYDNIEQLAWVENHKDVVQSAIALSSQTYRASNRNLKPSALAAFYIVTLMHEHDKESILGFHEKFVHGTHLGAGDPVLVLRNWAMNPDRKDETAQRQMAVIAKAYVKYLSGEVVQNMSVRLDERLADLR